MSDKAAQTGELRVTIDPKPPDRTLRSGEESVPVDVKGSVSVPLDLFLVIDVSGSLAPNRSRGRAKGRGSARMREQRNEAAPDHRSQVATDLVDSLPSSPDIRIGVVTFDKKARSFPLTSDRKDVKKRLQGLPRFGKTDLAEGIEAAFLGFEKARPRRDSSRVAVLFSDGELSSKKRRAAKEKAKEASRHGVTIHTVLLGEDDTGEETLREIEAGSTDGTFRRVSELLSTAPVELADAFPNLRPVRVEHVVLRVNGAKPGVRARLERDGRFEGRVCLHPGNNQIEAIAIAADEREETATVQVMVAQPGPVDVPRPTKPTRVADPGHEIDVTDAPGHGLDACVSEQIRLWRMLFEESYRCQRAFLRLVTQPYLDAQRAFLRGAGNAAPHPEEDPDG